MSKNNSKTPEKSVREALKSADCLTLAEQGKIKKNASRQYKHDKLEQKEKSVYEDGMKEAEENGWF